MTEPAAGRQERLLQARNTIAALPCRELFELARNPTVLYDLRQYDKLQEGPRLARFELPFLFKAFETGQAPPPRPGSKNAVENRPSTIHEYLDWTVTAEPPSPNFLLDFRGFRVVALTPRLKPGFPPPDVFKHERPRSTLRLGAPRNPLPPLIPNGKAICACTIRVGLGYLEVPFFATHESRRNRGYGRAMLECVEEVARALSVPRLLLCSTDDKETKNTWRSMGFVFTTPEDLQAFGVHPGDLLHMDNTVQMHKTVPPARRWKSLLLKHEHLWQRCYFPAQPAIPGDNEELAASAQLAISAVPPPGLPASAHIPAAPPDSPPRGLEARRLEGVDGAQSSDNSGLMGLGPARGLDGIGLGVERFQEEASTSPRLEDVPEGKLLAAGPTWPPLLGSYAIVNGAAQANGKLPTKRGIEQAGLPPDPNTSNGKIVKIETQ